MSFAARILPWLIALSVAFALYRILFKGRQDLLDCFSSLICSAIRRVFFRHHSREELRDNVEQMKLVILISVSAMAGLIARAMLIGLASDSP